jgi:hypothetical protein
MMIFLVSRHSEAWHSRAIGAKAQSFVAYFYKKFNSYSYSATPKMATKLRYKLDASQLSIDKNSTGIQFVLPEIKGN